MSRRGRPNTRLGGHAAQIGWRQISADPNGNREQRRAAKRLGVVDVPQPETTDTATPTCPHCGRTSHGSACTGTLSGGEPQC